MILPDSFLSVSLIPIHKDVLHILPKKMSQKISFIKDTLKTMATRKKPLKSEYKKHLKPRKQYFDNPEPFTIISI